MKTEFRINGEVRLEIKPESTAEADLLRMLLQTGELEVVTIGNDTTQGIVIQKIAKKVYRLSESQP
jgi:hypothetical protein